MPEGGAGGPPGLLGSAVAVKEGHQFLGAVETDTDDDQAAQPVLFQADVEVHPVCPPVHVVDAAGRRRSLRHQSFVAVVGSVDDAYAVNVCSATPARGRLEDYHCR